MYLATTQCMSMDELMNQLNLNLLGTVVVITTKQTLFNPAEITLIICWIKLGDWLGLVREEQAND